jgi:hypothetical protein
MNAEPFLPAVVGSPAAPGPYGIVSNEASAFYFTTGREYPGFVTDGFGSGGSLAPYAIDPFNAVSARGCGWEEERPVVVDGYCVEFVVCFSPFSPPEDVDAPSPPFSSSLPPFVALFLSDSPFPFLRFSSPSFPPPHFTATLPKASPAFPAPLTSILPTLTTSSTMPLPSSSSSLQPRWRATTARTFQFAPFPSPFFSFSLSLY